MASAAVAAAVIAVKKKEGVEVCIMSTDKYDAVHMVRLSGYSETPTLTSNGADFSSIQHNKQTVSLQVVF
jgi:hypothetical protein